MLQRAQALIGAALTVVAMALVVTSALAAMHRVPEVPLMLDFQDDWAVKVADEPPRLEATSPNGIRVSVKHLKTQSTTTRVPGSLRDSTPLEEIGDFKSDKKNRKLEKEGFGVLLQHGTLEVDGEEREAERWYLARLPDDPLTEETHIIQALAWSSDAKLDKFERDAIRTLMLSTRDAR